MIIDCHAHFEPRMLELDAMIAKLDEVGVDKVALIPAMNDPLPETPERLLSLARTLMRHAATRPVAELVHRCTLTRRGDLRLGGKRYAIYPQPDNEALAAALRRHPQRLLGWIFLNPAADPHVLDTLERFRNQPGLIGVKLHPHWHDYSTRTIGPLLGRCQELGLPVLIHLGFRHRGAFQELAAHFPRLILIAAHAGFPFYGDLWRYKNALPNLHVDLSSPYINERLARDAVEAMGPERCMFGTDAPYGFHATDGSYDYGQIRGWVERMPVKATKIDDMLGNTFARIARL